MFISPTDAVKFYDVSKPTLYKDMGDGRLSYTIDDRDRRKLNVAELDRLYQKRQTNFDGFTSAGVNLTDGLTEPNGNNPFISQQIKAIKEQIAQTKDREVELLEQQIEQLLAQVENLNRHLDETREEHRGYMRLLEDKRAEQGTHTSKFDEKLRDMEQQMSTIREENRRLQEERAERIRRAQERRKRKLTEETVKKNKIQNFFERLVG